MSQSCHDKCYGLYPSGVCEHNPECVKERDECMQKCEHPPAATEYYDPDKPVCNTQNDFNQAFRNAIDYNNKQNEKKVRVWAIVFAVLYFVFFIWAIILAVQVPAGTQRTQHLVLALVFSPAYVLAYYLGMLRGPKY